MTGLPLDSRRGTDMLMPCNHCSLALMPLRVEEGVHDLVCPRCSCLTKVTVSREKDAWTIKSAAA
jgi:phage FluMu protein Com